jgi:hypothetical protein
LLPREETGEAMQDPHACHYSDGERVEGMSDCAMSPGNSASPGASGRPQWFLARLPAPGRRSQRLILDNYIVWPNRAQTRIPSPGLR